MNSIMTVCEACYAANSARLDAERQASIVALPPSPPPTDAELEETDARIAESIYRFGNLLPEIAATIIDAAISLIEPPDGYPRRAACEVEVPGLGRVHVELTCRRRPKPRPPGGKVARYEFYWLAARAQRG